MGARIYADVNAEMRLRIFRALFFLLSISFFLSLDTNLKKKPKLFIPHVFFFFL